MKRLILILLVVFGSCSSNKKLMNKNLAYIYYNDPTIIHPQYRVYHKSDSISTLYFKINSREALYTKKIRDTIYRAELSLNYILHDIENPKDILDSATIHVRDQKLRSQQRYLSGSINFRAPLGKNYYLVVTINDKIRDQQVQNYQVVLRKDRSNRQNFLLYDQEGRIQFDNFVKKGEEVTIKCNNKGKGKLFGRFYSRQFNLPPPPFTIVEEEVLKYEADSLFEIDLESDSTIKLKCSGYGLFHIQNDTSGRNGITLYNFRGSFPDVKKPEDMLEPLKYLTTRQEYKNIDAKGANKETIDDFWFAVAGNRERGKAIIREFYNRIEEANRYFTSYLEGWKTDRGMIYLIYGPPNVIYKTLDSENWIYGEQNNVLSVNFTFYKVDNPFTENDYYLSRSPVYRSSWYRAVDSWRQGKVY